MEFIFKIRGRRVSLPKLVCLACYYLVAMHLPDNMLFIKWGGCEYEECYALISLRNAVKAL